MNGKSTIAGRLVGCAFEQKIDVGIGAQFMETGGVALQSHEQPAERDVHFAVEQTESRSKE